MEFMNKNQSIQTPIQLITKILLPFSVVSVILSYPLFANYQIQTLAYDLQLFSFSAGKNYMFLLCNGLLVFIATSSGLIGSFWVESDIKAEKSLKISKGELEVESPEPKGSILKEKVIVEDEGEEDRSNEIVSVEEEEDEDEEEEVELMSNEELNKKCEEFIRKMKQGIQVEARQPNNYGSIAEFDPTQRL